MDFCNTKWTLVEWANDSNSESRGLTTTSVQRVTLLIFLILWKQQVSSRTFCLTNSHIKNHRISLLWVTMLLLSVTSVISWVNTSKKKNHLYFDTSSSVNSRVPLSFSLRRKNKRRQATIKANTREGWAVKSLVAFAFELNIIKHLVPCSEATELPILASSSKL